jgi:cyclophilin family peptidyl-prolyl cis-trans isomerase
MPRRKKRRKPYSAADWTTQRAKARFPFSLFTNVKVFYVIGAVIMVGGLGVGALSRSVRSSSSSNTLATPQATVEVTPEPTPVAKTYSAPPPFSIDTAKKYSAVIKTDKGDIKVELLDDEAPQTVNDFVFLARQGFYDGLSFFYVNPDWSADTGDPTNSGTGGPGYDFPEEKPAPQETFARGDLGMINGSQFFIAYRDLDPSAGQTGAGAGFTLFGRVVEGMDVVDSLTPRNPSMRDAPPGDRILSIEINET